MASPPRIGPERLRTCPSVSVHASVVAVGLVLLVIATAWAPPAPSGGGRHRAVTDGTEVAAGRPAGGVGWFELNATGPSARSSASAAYDPLTDSVILFGGTGANGLPLRDCWALADGEWSSPCTGSTSNQSSSPPARAGAAMAYDPDLEAIVMFGGHGRYGALNDTWLFSAGQWTNLTGQLPLSPAARTGAAAAYDPSLHEVVLVGGRNVNTVFQDAWAFSADRWTPITPSNITSTNFPPRLFNESLTSDPATGGLLLFGGYTRVNQSYVASNQTWELVGGVWTERATPPALLARGGAAMAWDGGQGYAVLEGGAPYLSAPFGDSWGFNDSTGWFPLASGSSPGPRSQATAVGVNSSQSNGYVVLFGGTDNGRLLYGDTWLYGTPPLLVAPVTAQPSATDVGSPVNLSTSVVGGTGTYTVVWSGLPPGCASANGTTLRCTPAVPGHYHISVHVSTSGGQGPVMATGPLVVNGLPTILSFTVNPSDPALGQPISIVVLTTGGTGQLSYQYFGLPAGCPTNDTSAFSCRPNSTGTFALLVKVTDSQGSIATGSSVLTVTSPAAPSGGLGRVRIAEIAALGVVAALGVAYVVVRLRRRRARPKLPPSSSSTAGAQARGPT
jgi:hypothetical protein